MAGGAGLKGAARGFKLWRPAVSHVCGDPLECGGRSGPQESGEALTCSPVEGRAPELAQTQMHLRMIFQM